MINQVINQGARRLVITQRLRGVGEWSDNGLVAGHLCLWSFQVVRAVNVSVDPSVWMRWEAPASNYRPRTLTDAGQYPPEH